MQSLLKTTLIILLLSQMTLVSNGWEIGRVCLWIALLVSSYFLMQKYGVKSMGILLAVIFFRGLETVLPVAGFLYEISLVILFSATGFACYGASPEKIRKILVLYLLISIPF
jgi:hypothetical protein